MKLALKAAGMILGILFLGYVIFIVKLAAG